MNVFDEEDRRIEAIFKADIYEPDSYTQAIMTALSKNNKKKLTFNLSRLIAAIITAIMVASSIAYAEQIEQFILRFFNNNRGLDTAIEHGYIEETNAAIEEPKNGKMELEYYSMDYNNLNFIFKININEKLDINEITKINIVDMIIADDLHNIIYCISKNKFDEYCSENDLNCDFTTISKNYTNSDMIAYVKSYDSERKTAEICCNLNSRVPYPKSKRLHIEVSKIEINENSDYIIDGQWTTDIKVSDKFYNRSSREYRVLENSNLYMHVTGLNVYNTGTIFEVRANLTPYYTEDMDNEMIMQKKTEFMKWGEKLGHTVQNAYIENSEGERFSQTESNSNDLIITYLGDGTFYYRNSFTLTQYDATDTLTVHFTLNTIDGSEDVVIKLERDN